MFHYPLEFLPFLLGFAYGIGQSSSRGRRIACLSAGAACAVLSGELNAGWAASLLAITVDSLAAAAGYLTANSVHRAMARRDELRP